MTDQPLTPPQPSNAVPSPPPVPPPPPPPPSDSGGEFAIGTGPPPVAVVRRISVGWIIVALVACIVSVVGVFLPLLSVRGFSIDYKDQGVGVAVPWAYKNRVLATLLFERWEIALVLLVLAAAAAVVSLAKGRYGWPAAVGAVCAALAFHLLLSMVQRAEFRVVVRLDTPSYLVGAWMSVGGAFLALVGFVVALARRH